MRRFAAAIGCLAFGAVLWAGSAAAAPVGLIEEFDVNGNTIALVPGPDGNVWFTFDRDFNSPRGGAIGRITPRGRVTKFKAGLALRAKPGDIVIGPDGNLWFTDLGSPPAIGRITPQGEITEFRVGLDLESEPGSIVLGPDGNLWFTDTGAAPAIGRVTPQGKIVKHRPQQRSAEHLPRPAGKAGEAQRGHAGAGNGPGAGGDSPRSDRSPFGAEPADPDTSSPGLHRHRSILRPGERPLRAQGHRPQEAASLRLYHPESEGHLHAGRWLALLGIRVDSGGDAAALSDAVQRR